MCDKSLNKASVERCQVEIPLPAAQGGVRVNSYQAKNVLLNQMMQKQNVSQQEQQQKMLMQQPMQQQRVVNMQQQPMLMQQQRVVNMQQQPMLMQQKPVLMQQQQQQSMLMQQQPVLMQQQRVVNMQQQPMLMQQKPVLMQQQQQQPMLMQQQRVVNMQQQPMQQQPVLLQQPMFMQQQPVLMKSPASVSTQQMIFSPMASQTYSPVPDYLKSVSCAVSSFTPSTQQVPRPTPSPASQVVASGKILPVVPDHCSTAFVEDQAVAPAVVHTCGTDISHSPKSERKSTSSPIQQKSSSISNNADSLGSNLIHSPPNDPNKEATLSPLKVEPRSKQISEVEPENKKQRIETESDDDIVYPSSPSLYSQKEVKVKEEKDGKNKRKDKKERKKTRKVRHRAGKKESPAQPIQSQMANLPIFFPGYALQGYPFVGPVFLSPIK